MSSDDAAGLVREAGFDVGGVLGSGMEGVVFALDAGRVITVWFDRPEGDVSRLMAFSRAAGGATPAGRRDRVRDLGGRPRCIRRTTRDGPTPE